MKEGKEKNVVENKERGDAELTREGRVYIPATDIYEKDDAILIRCDMPGVARESIDIHLDNTELEITGTQAAMEQEGMDLLGGEYDVGVYRRKFSIPQLIDRDKIHATLKDGVLDVELPKAEQAKPRKIEITTG